MGYYLQEDGVSKFVLEDGSGDYLLEGPGGLSITDTGLATTDSLASLRLRPLTDTGLNVTDSIFRSFPIHDTGLTLTESLRSRRTRPLLDTGLTLTDSLGKIELVGTGLSCSDVLAKQRVVPRALADTGTIASDSAQKVARKVVTDGGLTLSADLVARKNGGNVSVNLASVGFTLTTSLGKNVALFRGVPASGALPEIGLRLTDGIGVTVNGGPADSCTLDFRRFLLDLDASPEYTAWCAANPADCSAWTTYATAILNGGSPSPPTMTDPDGLGAALVDAGVIALDGIIPCRAATHPKAAFSFAVGGLTVAFTNLSTPGESGDFGSWFWTFGDGDTETGLWNATHTYAGAGTYVVTLTVDGADGDGISVVQHLVTVFVPAVGNAFHIEAVIV